MQQRRKTTSFMDTTFTVGANRDVLDCFRMALKAEGESGRNVLTDFMRQYAVAAYGRHPMKFTLQQAEEIKNMAEVIKAGV